MDEPILKSGQWPNVAIDPRTGRHAATGTTVEKGGRLTATDKAVAQLKAYASYIHDHAENIVGDIDAPNYVAEGGMSISFALMDCDSVPTLIVSKEHIVIDALEVNG